MAELDILGTLREQVDGLDELIVALVSQRTKTTLAITEEKQRRGISVMATDRHTEVIANYMQARPEDGPMTISNVVALGEMVMEISRDAQTRHRQAAEQQQVSEREELAGLATLAAVEQGQ